MNELIFILFAIIVLAAVYFYVQRRKQQGAFGSTPREQASDDEVGPTA